jgi:hypothetical protein
MIEIIQGVLDGTLPYERAVAVLMAGLAMSREGAVALLGSEELAGSEKPAPIPEQLLPGGGDGDEEDEDEEEEEEVPPADEEDEE